MCSIKIPCKNKECNAEILETTAAKTGGYCYPCYNKIEAVKREEYIKKNRKDINLYEGITDNVEIIKIMYSNAKYDPLIRYVPYSKTLEELYNSLTDSDIERLMEYANELYKNSDDKWETILLSLVSLRDVNIDEFLLNLVNDDCYYPAELFINASSKISKMILEKINNNSNDVNINHALSALAWIGDEEVVNAFNEWRINKPDFTARLYILPHEYSYEGGWKLDDKGKKKELIFNQCYGISKENSMIDDAVIYLEENEEQCGVCGRKLTSLITINLNNNYMRFFNIEGEYINISSCDYCGCYGEFYTEIDVKGNSKWSTLNEKSKYLSIDDEDEVDKYKYDKKIYFNNIRKSNNYGISQFVDIPFTKVGGYPTWIQNSQYPKCKKCGEDVIFVGQVSMEDVMEYGEGIYYCFICEECKQAATVYQQT